jgi:hypothetical protein
MSEVRFLYLMRTFYENRAIMGYNINIPNPKKSHFFLNEKIAKESAKEIRIIEIIYYIL